MSPILGFTRDKNFRHVGICSSHFIPSIEQLIRHKFSGGCVHMYIEMELIEAGK
jgi:hypothetical protein